jgi:hypothetical protein
LQDLQHFLDAALAPPAALWEAGTLRASASLQVPDVLFVNRSWLLRADINQVWSEWFLEAMCDVKALGLRTTYPALFEVIWQRVETLALPSVPKDEKKSVSKTIADLLQRRMEAQRVVKRAAQSVSIKRELVDMCHADPRCWICGYPFCERELDRFLGRGGVGRGSLPMFVDFISQRGMTSRDFQVEIDHVNPFSAGGRDGENLRLSCGWCNASKSWKTSLYQCGTDCVRGKHPSLGVLSLPSRFWIVRLMASRRQCECPEGCTVTSAKEQLYVSPMSLKGAMNPMNLVVTCRGHDTLIEKRFVARSEARHG